MLSLYFVYLDLGLDTRVFVCICLLATLDTHSTRTYSLLAHTRHAYHAISRRMAASLSATSDSSPSLSSPECSESSSLSQRSTSGLQPARVGVCDWRHGDRHQCSEGGKHRTTMYLVVYLVCICFQDKNTPDTRVSARSFSVFNI